MSRVMIIGAGGVGHVVAHKCAQVPEVFSDIMLASRTRSKCDAIAAGIKAVQTAITRTKLRNIKAARPEVDAYINKVLEFEDRQQQTNP